MYSTQHQTSTPMRPGLWLWITNAPKFEIEFKSYQVACGIVKLKHAVTAQEARIGKFKEAQMHAMQRIEMRLKTRIIPMMKEQDEMPPEHAVELRAAVDDASIYLRSETILNVLVPTANRLKNKLAEYDRLHMQLVIGSELDGLNAMLGQMSAGVPIQSVVNKVLTNTEKFADNTGLDSVLAEASDEIAEANKELNMTSILK
jgi:hypothetical protein